MDKKQISLQVYSARNFKPYDNIFKFLSEQGMQNVELFEVEAFDEKVEKFTEHEQGLQNQISTLTDEVKAAKEAAK